MKDNCEKFCLSSKKIDIIPAEFWVVDTCGDKVTPTVVEFYKLQNIVLLLCSGCTFEELKSI